ncbi:MAG: tetraacyldisaccharide 4'-kinase [Deltaproteobacteria bacterium]|nr:tetraacyldisaccharide 4'-kinase [Candidatus Zymogenaceae bacterium]
MVPGGCAERCIGWVERLYQDRASRYRVMLLFFPVYLVGLIYGLVMKIRAFLYRVRLFESYSVSACVVSVGNISVGGQGKTPVVMHLARRLTERGISVSVVSRGYGFEVAGEYLVVSDRNGPVCSPGDAPDEALLTAWRNPGVSVVVSPNRVAAARAAVSRFGAQVVLIDDGFQHLRLHRDLDVLVADRVNQVGNSLVFPAGPLREPLSAARRGDVLWLSEAAVESTSHEDGPGPIERVCGTIPRVYSVPVPLALVDGDGTEYPARALEKKKALAFCGIARPQRFFDTLEDIGVIVVYTLPFRDHHRFSENDYAAINHVAARFGAEVIVTTEKDLMRIGDHTLSHRLLAVRMGLRVQEDEGVIAMIESCVRAYNEEG